MVFILFNFTITKNFIFCYLEITLVLGHFPDGLFPDGQFPEGHFLERAIPRKGISPTDSSPNEISPNGHLLERTFPRIKFFFIYLNLYLPLVYKRSQS